MHKSTIDLHMHTWYSSDGEYQPDVLVKMCAEAGISVMAIADHNCVKAVKPAQAAAKEYGIRLIPGIEIDCTYETVNFHVLGYGIDVSDPVFERIEQNVTDQGLNASAVMLEGVRRLGFDISEAEMQALDQGRYCKGCWTGEMFAEVLLNKPEYESSELLKPYRTGGSRSDNPYVNFYWDWCSQGKPCYAEVKYPSMEEIIQQIHSAGGIAVLAHPGVNLKGHEALLAGIIDLGIEGIEAYSSYHTAEVSEYYAKAAQDAHLLITCGSDFHGKTKPAISLGQTGLAIEESNVLKALSERGLLSI